MNEQVLKAIVKLLAMIVKVDGVGEGERESIEAFFQENLNDTAVKHYLHLFDEHLQTAIATREEVYKLCQTINLELSLKQKTIILLRLIELVLADRQFTQAEENLVEAVCEAFNIQTERYQMIRDFVTATNLYDVDSPHILVVDDLPHQNLRTKHYYKNQLGGKLGILRLPGVEMYLLRVFRYTEDIFLNGDLLRKEYVYPLTNGSVIRSSRLEPLYYSEIVGNFMRAEYTPRVTFVAENIDYHFKGGKKGLHKINIAEESGKLIALMGASGSGKSTLLNVLNGNYRPSKGRVLINGIDVHAERESITGVIGYVPQDDLLMEDLTVYQNLYFAARLCFSQKSEREIEVLVTRTLINLGLNEICHLKVGNVLEKTISGGQRKRVNIGLELLRQPSVLFLDEPTSGLSSRDSENILDLLRELTMMGKLIFVVIHQPSSELFKMFDRLIVLDTGGYQVYYGDPVEAVVYFKTLANQVNKELGACQACGNVNAEQIFNIIENKVIDEYGNPTSMRRISPETWYKYFLQNIRMPSLKSSSEKPENTLRIPSLWNQFRIFVARDMLSKWHNTQYLVINLLQAPLLAFILAYIVRYYKPDELTEDNFYTFAENVNIPAFIFMSIIVALFMGLTISAEEIIRDARILKREAFLNLSRNSYLMSKVFILFSFSAFQAGVYTLISNWIVGIEGMTLTYWGVYFTCFCFANMLGLNISATFKSVVTIYILIPILLIPQLILGGIVVEFDKINPEINRPDEVPLVGDLMASRWAFEALAVSQFKDNPFEREFYELDKVMANAEYKRDYLIPTLSSKLEACIELREHNGAAEREKLVKNLNLLSNELRKELKATPELTLASVSRLKPGSFNFDVSEQTKQYLKELKGYYINVYNKAREKKDELTSGRTASPEAQEAFLKAKESYQNEQIAFLVTNRSVEDRIIEYKGRLIQKINPVYLDPVELHHPFDFRAHFFAPTKHFLGTYIPTLFFNVMLVWLMSFLLYITLYNKFFRKLIGGKYFRRKRL
jgi:ABC transport system ATP-binding/permease protein